MPLGCDGVSGCVKYGNFGADKYWTVAATKTPVIRFGGGGGGGGGGCGRCRREVGQLVPTGRRRRRTSTRVGWPRDGGGGGADGDRDARSACRVSARTATKTQTDSAASSDLFVVNNRQRSAEKKRDI